MKVLKLLWRYYLVSYNIRKAEKYGEQPNVSEFYYGKARYYGNNKV